ncbi:hypothetical protein BGV71_10555 [Burkholderia ubonensis]|uniref:diiron oxygenase n=1 Tax=Burkholderia ubonensis TaxID=101571 RepID=UPI0007555E16|nr:diiron oxygenase [Burkholderia ubonensis]KVC86738.1 hypothetical protein WI76_04495 [Burkholderia ubonensis]KVZ28684.1 hypothetical protein WL13_32900 [Burkholderia ubonensis]KWB34813.1 hypothetical protein WL33_19660 [Burkholderia ubonensis]KWC26452.1 hypothetical protein WL50_07590 [Burkholderia ubonensis]OJA86267.1 hypothetical protein BGV71_10555 [Burkholderia ubonensis]
MQESLEHIENPIQMSEGDRAKIGVLIRASHRSPMSLEDVLPWGDGIDKSKLPKRKDGGWIYGTGQWKALTGDQQRELLWKELARDISMFIWLEQSLPPLYVGYVNKYPFELHPEVYEYLMIFSKEEITHTLMFRRYMKMAGLPLYSPPKGFYAQFTQQLPTLHPAVGILSTLMIEWGAELNAMYLTQRDDVDPLTRKMFHAHHVEEARHIAFGKRVIESFFASTPAEVLAPIRAQFAQTYRNFREEITFNRDIALHTSFSFPIDVTDDTAVAEVRNSENNRRLNAERMGEMDRWFAQLGISDDR